MMKHAILIAALLGASPAIAEPCYNTAFNISRTSECMSYTTDRQKQNDLKDKRLEAINEWIQLNPLGGSALELMIKEGDRRMNSALARDYELFSDKNMWEARGCATLPLCAKDMPDSLFPPRAKRATPRPVTRPKNTRTGGAWCGPKDRAHGYCNWRGWLK